MNTYRLTGIFSRAATGLGEFSKEFPGCTALEDTASFVTVFHAENDPLAIVVAKDFMECETEEEVGKSVELVRGGYIGGRFYPAETIYRATN